MSDRLERLTPDRLDAEQAALYDAITRGRRAEGPQHFALQGDDGTLHGPFGPMLHAPAVGAPLQQLGTALRYDSSLPDRLRELVTLQVAAGTGSAFEWYAHVRTGSAVGVRHDELEALAAGEPVGDDDAERAASALCAAVLDGEVVAAHLVTAVREQLGDRAAVELVVLVGYYRALASLLEVFAIEPPDQP